MRKKKRKRVVTDTRIARLRAGMTSQQALADRVHVARTTITAIENGVSVPAVTLAIAIARELDSTVEELWGRRPPAI